MVIEEDNNDIDDQYEDDGQLEANSAEDESNKDYDKNFINDDGESSEDEDFDPSQIKKKKRK